MNWPNWYLFWGKTNRKVGKELEFHLLAYHCLDVAACGMVLLNKMPRFGRAAAAALGLSEEHTVNYLVWFLATHDIGKFSGTFQNFSPEAMAKLGLDVPSRKSGVRHDTFGYWAFLNRFIAGRDDYHHAESYLKPIARVVYGHHGRPPKPMPNNWDYEDSFGDVEDPALREFWAEIDTLFHFNEAGLPDEPPSGLTSFSWIIAGFVVLADWLGSNSDAFGFHTEPMPLADYFEQALRRAERLIDESGVLPEPVRPHNSFRSIFGNDPRPMQEWADTVPLDGTPKCFIIEDSTGSGKTEAALTLASRLMSDGLADGVYVGLPTMATANQMFSRIGRFYRSFYVDGRQPSLSLAHGKKQFVEGYRSIILHQAEGESDEERHKEDTSRAVCKAWVADSNRVALSASFSIGTVDQVLLAGLCTQYQSLRCFGLFGKVLIVDEVHAYDVYMSALLHNMITMHASHGGSVILLSATLPIETRQALADAYAAGIGRASEPLECDVYPAATTVSMGDMRTEAVAAVPNRDRSHDVITTSEIAEIYDAIVDAAAAGQCVCWIRNTVNDAVESYQELKSRLGDVVDLFHARFSVADRQKIEDRVLYRFGEPSGQTERAGRILVATQVVEQSLDLDFDLLVSDLAPIDLLVQRAGRQHRHTRDSVGNRSPVDGRGEPKLWVYGPDYDPNPDEDWHSRFGKSCFVYDDTRVVYRTAKVLRERQRLVIPRDSRSLIEDVYRDREDVPSAIATASDKAIGEEGSHREFGKFVRIKWADGYSQNASWASDLQYSTRLGSMRVRVWLAEWDGVRLSPYAQGGHGLERWIRSEVSAPMSALADVSLEPDLVKAIETLKKKVRSARYVQILPHELCYSKELGLHSGGSL